MFDNLLETRRQKTRGAGGIFGSFVVHALVIGGAVFATASGTVAQLIEDKQEKVDFIKKEEPPPEVKPPPPDVVVAPPPPKGFQVLIAPVEIPDVLPEIDLSKKMTDEADFSGKGVAGGTSTGVVGGVPQMINSDQTYYEFQVEKQAARLPGTGDPIYPEMLKAAGFQGKVLVTFVIDTTGRADPATFKVLSSSHDLFTKAVREQLPRMKFLPAEVGGRKVKQLVQQPFEFSIR